jgi:hypothetical protein
MRGGWDRQVGRVSTRMAAGIAGLAVTVALLPTGAGARPSPEPSVTVEPSTHLVDGDKVTVTITGIDVERETYVEVLQCVSGATTREDCDLNRGGQGWSSNGDVVTVPFLVTTMVYPGFGEVSSPATDCRESGACVIRVSVDDHLLEHLPLHFDPDASLAPPPTISVTPNEQLDDLESVQVGGSGFVWTLFAYLRQCVADPAGLGDCDRDQSRSVLLSESGDFFEGEVAVSALALIETRNHGIVDCREPDRCVIAATSPFSLVPERTATAPVSFDPDAEIVRPALTVSPDSDLVDGDTVTVTGRDFHARYYPPLAICPAGASERNECHPLAWPEADATGHFSIDVTVPASFTPAAGTDEVDCRSVSDPCALVFSAGESITSPRAARAELHFRS